MKLQSLEVQQTASTGKKILYHAITPILLCALFVLPVFLFTPPVYGTTTSDDVPDWSRVGAVWDTQATTLDTDNTTVVYEAGSSTGSARTLQSNTQITFQNKAGEALPVTGGSGIGSYILIGTVFICAAGAMLWMKRCRNSYAVADGIAENGSRNASRGTDADGTARMRCCNTCNTDANTQMKSAGSRKEIFGRRGHLFQMLLTFAAAGIAAAGIGAGISVLAANSSDLSSLSASEVEAYVTHADLRIANTVNGDTGAEEYFKVSVSLADSAAGSYTISGADSTVTFVGSTVTNPTSMTIGSDGTGAVDLYIKSGETIVIEDLPVDTTYTAAESGNDGCYTSYQVEATAMQTKTLTITPYLNVSGWTTDQGRLHDAYKYTIPRGATINLETFGLNDPDLTFLYWNSSLWSWSGQSTRATTLAMDADYSIEEWYRSTFGYYMVVLDRGFYTDNQGYEVAEGTADSAYNYGFIQFGLANDATAALSEQANNTRSGYTFGGWYTEPNGQGDKIEDVLDGEIDISSYSSASAYLTAFTKRRDTLKENLLDKAADSTEAQRQGLRDYQALLKTGRGSTFTESDSYVAVKTLYAYWIPTGYTDTVYNRISSNIFSSNGVTGITSSWNFHSADVTLTQGATLTMDSSVLSELYGFEVYQINSSGNGTWNADPPAVGSVFTQGEGTTNITAYYQPETYNITYELEGGTNASGAQNTYTVLTGYALPTPTRSGYKFTGWVDSDNNPVTDTNYDNSTLTTENFITEIQKRQIGDITLKATWTPAAYTDTMYHRVSEWVFTNNHVSGITETLNFATTSIAANEGDQITMDDTVLQTLNGFEVYQINSENSAGNGSWDTTGTPKAGNVFTQGAGSTRFTAYYSPISYSISYNTDGGNTISDDSYNVLTGFTLPTPTKSGYVFTGWYDSAGNKVESTNYDNSSLTADNFVSTMASRTSGNLSLTAHWTDADTYTVKFDANAADATGTMADQTLIVGEAGTLNRSAFTRTNYEFLGWSADPNATTATYTDGASVTNLASAGTDVTLYAVWRIKQMTIEWKVVTESGGPALSSGSKDYNYGTTITLDSDLLTDLGVTIPEGYELDFIQDYSYYKDWERHTGASHTITGYDANGDAITKEELQIYIKAAS